MSIPDNNESIKFSAPSADPRSPERIIRVLDATEAAALVRMDSRTLIRWARLGYVPAHPLGEGKRRLWRFSEDEIIDWYKRRLLVQKRPSGRVAASGMTDHSTRLA